jgi:hypothetical protein
METTRQQLHTLVDMVEETGFNDIYDFMVRFVPEDEALPDEIISHEIAMEEYRRGETIRQEDINWD